ncbi:MAG: penicillin-binding protein 2 [Candidatus Aminicenantes bacterium]|nr:penicillin-binding protein 2 [Candidatus Aminicenantes bacterium]
MNELAHELEQRKARRRTRFLAVVLGLWAAGILGQLVRLQAFQHAKMRDQVTNQSEKRAEVKADRGTIYDRRGHILAQSVSSFSISYRQEKSSPLNARMAPVLKAAPLLGIGPAELEKICRQVESGAPYIFLRRKVGPEMVRRVQEAKIRGLSYDEERRRVYPHGTLAAHVLGGVNLDETGLAGVEYRHNPALGGRPGERRVLKDGNGREYNVEIVTSPKPGQDLVLTLDHIVQYEAQSALEMAAAEHDVEWGTVIVSVPPTGEILAMASVPGYDPNAYTSAKDEQRIDRSIRHLFDPGSTFKIVTAATVIETGVVVPGESFNCAANAIQVAGGQIRDHEAFGVLTFADVIAHSSNIGTIQAARRLEPDLFYRAIRDFGFGERTGIELPAEAAGLLNPPEKWSGRSLDSLSVGYEINVTAVQLLQALNIIANRGERVGLNLLKSVGGRPRPAEPSSPAPTLVSPAAAESLVRILVRAVEEGTGTGARLPGYSVAGKTGTAQLFDRSAGRYTSAKHLAVFAGFVPADRPALSILVVFCDPKKKDVYYGGQVAAPVFRDIALKVLRYLGVHPGTARPATGVTARLQNEAQR